MVIPNHHPSWPLALLPLGFYSHFHGGTEHTSQNWWMTLLAAELYPAPDSVHYYSSLGQCHPSSSLVLLLLGLHYQSQQASATEAQNTLVKMGPGHTSQNRTLADPIGPETQYTPVERTDTIGFTRSPHQPKIDSAALTEVKPEQGNWGPQNLMETPYWMWRLINHQNPWNTKARRPERKQKWKNKTPIQERQTQKATPRSVITPNPDA